MNVYLPNPVTGVAYTAEMNRINDATLPVGLPPEFDSDYSFFSNGVYPQLAAGAAPGPSGSAAPSGPYNGPYSDRTIFGEPIAVILAFILFLIGLKWFSERPDTLGAANPAYIRVGGYNVAIIFILAGLASIFWKVVGQKTNVPGVKEFALAAG